MKIMSTVILVCALSFLFAGFSQAADVLLLGDGQSEPQVQTALENAGHNVTTVTYYYDWDGLSPDPNNFDVIVALDGYDYGYQFDPAAASALDSFVAAGCGLVFTEWTAYDVYSDYKGTTIANLMPAYTPDGSYAYGDTWTVLNTSHPLVNGVPASWTDSAGFSIVTAKPNTTVVIEGSNSNPLLAYSNENGGTVVYINHDMTYTTSTINSNALQLIANAVSYTSGCRAAAAGAVSVPALDHWGMAIFITIAGLVSVYMVSRKKHLPRRR